MLLTILSYTITFIIIIILALTSLYLMLLTFSFLKGAPYVPTRNKDFDKVFYKIDIKKGSNVVDLGCGDGRVLFYLAKKYQVNGFGYDINPWLISWAKIISKIKEYDLQFKREDVRNADLKNADIIYIYLFPKLIEELKEKLTQQTKKEVIIISHAFRIKELNNFKEIENNGEKFKTFIYKRLG